MGKMIKWGLRIVGILGVLAALLVGIAYTFMQRTVPGYEGHVNLSALANDAEVTFDEHAIPHIKAESIIDAVTVQGYLHARDRLWQMETTRMAGQGRLSEIFGSATIDTDRYLRTMGLAEVARKNYEALKPETKEILDAYARGVNAYINRTTGFFEPAFGPEFIILSHKPEPWQPWQSILTVKVMALTLESNMSKEIQRLILASKKFTPEEIDLLVPYGPKDKPGALPNLYELYGFERFASAQNSSKTDRKSTQLAQGGSTQPQNGFELPWPIGVTASNNWVVGGSRTQSGKVLLANDPHLGLTAPSIWYLNHLSFQVDGKAVNLIGATIPSLPLLTLGRNDHLAWGFTTTTLDTQDLYLEQLNPKDSDAYLVEEGATADSNVYRSFDVRDEVIKVSGGNDVHYQVKSSRHGPVLPETFRNIKAYTPKGHVLALKWQAHDINDNTLDSIIDMNLAREVDQFFNAVRSWKSPMQTMVVGDDQGNIGMIAPGTVPIRDPENRLSGRAPLLGWKAEYEWQGHLSFDQLPQFKNPDQGVLFSANANFLKEDYPHYISVDWAKPYRHQRVKQLIADANEPHTVQSMIKGQADTHSDALLKMRNIALTQMDNGTGAPEIILQALKAWDGSMDKDRPEPLIMIAWFENLQKLILKDDLGESYKRFAKGDVQVVNAILGNAPGRNWCDDQKTTTVEDCGAILYQALAAALEQLKQAYGDDWRQWHWGKAHIAYGEHRPFAKVGLLANYFNVEIPSSGGPYTLHRGQTDFGEDKPYFNRHASSLRAIYDFSNLNKSLYIQTTGQSGNFLSKFYKDQSKPWSENQYLPMSTDTDDYAKNSLGKLEFKR